MSLRAGMSELISIFRAGVSDLGTAAFTDDRAQQILDARRLDFWQSALSPIALQITAGSVTYRVYAARHRNLEGTASGSIVFRLYDGNGTAITSGVSSSDRPIPSRTCISSVFPSNIRTPHIVL